MRDYGSSQEGTRGICLILAGVAILLPVLIAARAHANEAEPGVSATLTTAPLEEDAACAKCHEKIVKTSLNKPHASEKQPDGGPGVSCASCHGPGEAHIESEGDKSKILNPAEAPARQVEDSCLKCHAGRHVMFERSAHGESNVSCVRCHSIHSARDSRHLLKVAEPDLCFQCHEDQKSQFSSPYRHKVIEGVILCTDCHDPHGGFGEQLQRSKTKQQERTCTKCHMATAGPFEYEHAIVKTEGCTACHLPHGGPNSHMLNRAKVNTLCLLCHFPPRVSSTGDSLIEGHDLATASQLCTDCHADVHGSNVSAVFLKKK